MDRRSQMEWVQRNRRRGADVRRAGDVADQVMVKVRSAAWRSCGAIAEALAPVVDEEFRRWCRIGGMQAGRLTIHVRHPDYVYPMRIHWLFPLREQLQRARRNLRVSSITFEYGRDGVEIPAPEDSAPAGAG